MTNDVLTDLLMSLGLLSVFLLIGFLFRSKIKLFQSTFIPSSVLGGFILLLLGPQVLNVLPIPSEWFQYYSLLPGILIIPIVTATPLGMNLQKNEQKQVQNFMKNVLPLTCIGIVICLIQFAVGYGIHALFSTTYDFYDVFGIELGIGFVGGHGTAGTLGNILSNLNLTYWNTSQGVATTTATFGLVGGLLIGICLINWAVRKKYITFLNQPSDIPLSMKLGFEKDISKQSSTGRETTLSSSIDVYAFHIAIIFIGCLLANLFLKLVKILNIPVLSNISIWAYGMIIMFIIWGIICKLNLDYLFDSKVKGHITGSLTDFAVISAVASLPIKSVSTYLIPIIVMVVLGFILTTIVLTVLCKYLLNGYWFEQMISMFGMSTGVFLTGLLLLRICDPDLKSPALASYSFSYSLTSICYFIGLNAFILLPIYTNAFITMIVSIICALIFTLLAIFLSRLCFRKIDS